MCVRRVLYSDGVGGSVGARGPTVIIIGVLSIGQIESINRVGPAAAGFGPKTGKPVKRKRK